MVGIIAVIIIMVVVNLLMIFAIVKSAGQLEGTIRKYFIAHLGDEGVKREMTGEAQGAAAPAGIPVTALQKDAPSQQEEPGTSHTSDADALMAAQAMHLDAAQYKNASFKEDYRAMRRMDLLNKEAALSNVVEIQDEAGSGKSVFAGLAEILDYDTAFRLSSLDPDTQLQILDESLSQEQKEILGSYRDAHVSGFDILDFYGYIQEQAKLDEDVYYVYKAKGAPDTIAQTGNIRSAEDDSITEGVKIVYKNKLYDYSV